MISERIVSWLRSVREPWSVWLLKAARKEPDPDTQFFACKALSAMEQEWLDEIKALDRSIELEPDKVELREKLVERYLALIDSGILAGSISKLFLAKALVHTRAGLSGDPHNVKLLLHLGKLLLAMGSYEEALTALTVAEALRPDYTPCRIKKAEALYYLSRFREVSEIFRMMEPGPGAPAEGTIRHWREHAA